MQAMKVGQEFMDWIEEQNREKNYPDFGEQCQIKKIENLQNMPNLATVDWENALAAVPDTMQGCIFREGEVEHEIKRVNERLYHRREL